jgi:hypothetical protein
METNDYQWSNKDKWLYVLSMLPFVIGFVGTAYVLAAQSIIIMIVWLTLYVVTNVFQAGCCVGCPYQGKYCPALCGVYLGNFLSTIIYKNRRFDQAFFERNATAGELMLLVCVAFPLYWLFQTAWFLVPIYLFLLAAHFVIFMPTQCEKCAYNTTCPGGQSWLSCRQKLGLGGNLKQ